MDLADARNKAKAQMKKHEAGSNEYAGFNALQLAYKRAAASCYGLMGMEGNGESDMVVASTITFMGRSLVERLMEICGEMGYEPLAGHTDSAYIGIGDADGDEAAAAAPASTTAAKKVARAPDSMSAEEEAAWVRTFEARFRSTLR